MTGIEPKKCQRPRIWLHRFDLSEQTAHRGCAQGNHDLRLDKLNLLPEIRQTSLHLGGCRLTISRSPWGYVRTAFQNVGDINIRTLIAHRLNDLG